MTKKDSFRHKLASIIDSPSDVEEFLTSHSGLPGPKANLDLATAFADLVEEGGLQPVWLERLLLWANRSALHAPANHPTEFLPFVAIESLGAWSLRPNAPVEIIEATLRRAAHDPRWRIRDACVAGLQRIGIARPDTFLDWSSTWMVSPSLLEIRAILMALVLAHPSLLQTPSLLSFSFEVADQAFTTLLDLPEASLDSEQGKTLRKALELAPSLLVAADPKRGFSLLEKWADLGSPLSARVVAANLRKARVARHFPDEVQDVVLRLQAAFPEE